MATNSDSSWVDKELGEMVGKVLDHSTNRMPGEAQMYKMYIEKAKQKILQKMNEAEGRGRVSVVSALKEWADDTELTYNQFIENELEKIARLKSLESNKESKGE